MSDKELIEQVSKVVLPPFMTFPEPMKDVYTISDNGEKYVIEGTEEEFDSFFDARDYVKKTLKGLARFDKLPRVEGGEDGGMISRGMRFIVAEVPHIDLIKYRYLTFLEQDKEYRADPDDWYKAYHWLENHPAFYHRSEKRMNDWVMNEGLSGMWKAVTKTSKTNETVVLLEHGSWMNEDKTGSPSHDHRLDVWAPTFEEGYIAFAKVVDKHFDTAGIDRGIEEEPPEALKIALERYEEWKKENGED